MFDWRAITILSGGQTGADRAALDFAIEHGIRHGGWCPRGRLAEDGPISARYQLREAPTARYAQRTQWNVRDADATVIFTLGAEMQGGTALTRELAVRLGKPWLHLVGEQLTEAVILDAAMRLVAFLKEQNARRINIAGPRASQEPEVANFVGRVLETALRLGNM